MGREWRLVPVDPTADMVEAGEIPLAKYEGESGSDRWYIEAFGAVKDIYKAMIDAAPKPPEVKDTEREVEGE